MPRRPTGSIYESGGSFYLSVTLDKRRHFRLEACSNEADAELRRQLVVAIASKLKKAGHVDRAINFCEHAAVVDDETLGKLLKVMEGLLSGKERENPKRGQRARAGQMMTVREFGEQLFTSNELARRYRKRVREVDHTENIRRLNNHVYPVVYNGRSIADTPLDEFELDQADFVLDQPTVPDGSIRHVAQVMHRLFALAVYPARLLKQSPFPRGWLPAANDPKERSYLFPEEEAAVLGLPHEQLPLVWRVFFGFCAREGLRRENAVTIEWSDIHFDVGTGGSTVSLDTTKNGRGGFWKLDAGTAEALRRWKPMCPSERLVFPAEAHPRYWRKRAGKPLQVDKAAERLRDGLIVASTLEEKAGRKRIRLRAQLLERSENRIRLRAHDLRATFVTLALALGKTEAWVTQRTGHLSSTSIRGYMRDAETAEELDLGWLEPMHEVIPELAAVGHDEDVGNDVPTFPGAEKSE